MKLRIPEGSTDSEGRSSPTEHMKMAQRSCCLSLVLKNEKCHWPSAAIKNWVVWGSWAGVRMKASGWEQICYTVSVSLPLLLIPARIYKMEIIAPALTIPEWPWVSGARVLKQDNNERKVPWVGKELVNPIFLFEDYSDTFTVWWELEESEDTHFGESPIEGLRFQHKQKEKKENWNPERSNAAQVWGKATK